MDENGFPHREGTPIQVSPLNGLFRDQSREDPRWRKGTCCIASSTVSTGAYGVRDSRKIADRCVAARLRALYMRSESPCSDGCIESYNSGNDSGSNGVKSRSQEVETWQRTFQGF